MSITVNQDDMVKDIHSYNISLEQQIHQQIIQTRN